MRKWAFLIGIMAVVTGLTFPSSAFGGSVVVADSLTNTVGLDVGSIPDGQLAGQSFTAIDGTLDSAKLYLANYYDLSGSVYAYLYAHTGTFGENACQ